jgi:serine/threonine protein kinase
VVGQGSNLDPVPRLNAALWGRYRVERKLGEGGMAIVYLATDLRHNRKVALKVLKPDLAAALGADRFLAEVNTTANLQHPHILPLHDSGEADGFLFYTMPFVEGETLRQRLDRERRLPENEAIRITTDVADALQLAHERGVVHRDIKPSNILLSRGKALLADFGIARVAGVEAATSLTQTGTLLGTAGYMSPEQARGAPDVDRRSDIYSLGCVLFEMLVGEPPYVGRTLLEMLTRQATESAPSVRARRPDTSGGLDRAISVALAAQAAQRFESAVAFASALADRRGGSRGPAPIARTVVVLPFVNRSADRDDEYFSDGLTDEVITDLSRVSALRVISRNSAMALKGTTKDTRTLARELGVTHLVTGTVRRAGQSLRITAELVDADADVPIWSEKFSGSMDDVFGIQEDISRQIVAALKVNLTAAEERRVADRPIDDPVAYDAYLRACQVMYDWTPEAQTRAMRLVEQAIDIAGEVPVLLAMQGQLHWNMVNTSSVPADVGLARAAELADRALALDADSYLAIFVRGLVACTRGRPEEGLVDLYRAHELRPGDVNVRLEMNRFSVAAGLQHSERHVKRLVELDPLSPQAHLMVAMHAYYAMHAPGGPVAASARRAIQLSPDASMLHTHAGWLIGASGLRSEAVAVLDRVRSHTSAQLAALASFLSCALEGDEEGALRAITREAEQTISNEFLYLIMAQAYARLGRGDDALRMLGAAVRLGFISYPCLTTSATLIQCLKGDPGYGALLSEIKPRWERVVDWERGLIS